MPQLTFARAAARVIDITGTLLNNRTMPGLLVLLAAGCFDTTGTAQALGPDAAPLTVGAIRIAEPLTATGLGILALGERPGTTAAIGAALVLAGLLTLAAPERRAKPRLAAATA